MKGFQQKPGVDVTETFANTINPISYRLLLAFAAWKDLEIRQWDVKNAYPNAAITEELYTEQPIGFVDPEQPNHVCQVHKALNGLKQAAREWQTYLRKLLAKCGLVPSKVDQNIYFRQSEPFLAIGVYVDDLLVVGATLIDIDSLLKQLNQEIIVNDLGNASLFLGIEIHRDRSNRSITLSQASYIQKILTRFGQKTTNSPKPMLPITDKLDQNPDQATPEAVEAYQQAIGSILYAMTKTRPDIAYATGLLARFMSNPSYEHQSALNKLWKYLGNCPNLVLHYQFDPGSKLKIVGYSDADWGGDYQTRHSTTGYVFTIEDTAKPYSTACAISWQSRLQRTTALSSCEAEYMALKETFKEMLYIRQLCQDIPAFQEISANQVYTDSQSAILLANNPQYHHKTKHVDIQYHFVRELVLNHVIQLTHIGTDQQIADGLTKSLSQQKFTRLVEGLGLK